MQKAQTVKYKKNKNQKTKTRKKIRYHQYLECLPFKGYPVEDRKKITPIDLRGIHSTQIWKKGLITF